MALTSKRELNRSESLARLDTDRLTIGTVGRLVTVKPAANAAKIQSSGIGRDNCKRPAEHDFSLRRLRSRRSARPDRDRATRRRRDYLVGQTRIDHRTAKQPDHYNNVRKLTASVTRDRRIAGLAIVGYLA